MYDRRHLLSACGYNSFEISVGEGGKYGNCSMQNEYRQGGVKVVRI
jgi:hypothetical protein